MMFNVVSLGVASAHMTLSTDLAETKTGTYTLVQFVSSPACLNSAMKMCHTDLTTTTFTHLTSDHQLVCTKLDEKEGKFQVDSCIGTGTSCPESTCGHCKGFFHGDLVLNTCNDGYMLVDGKPDYCGPNNQDVGLGRWCDKAPTPAEPVQENKKDESPALITMATVYQQMSQNPLPEQGFEGAGVQHKNQETTVSNWRKEYGPNGPQAASGAAALSAWAALLFLVF